MKNNDIKTYIALLVLAIILYLFALNGRYKEISRGGHFDSWKGKYYFAQPGEKTKE